MNLFLIVPNFGVHGIREQSSIQIDQIFAIFVRCGLDDRKGKAQACGPWLLHAPVFQPAFGLE